jgi:ABC-type branched-subunit amino acid transport system substrate-binding protein
VPPIASSSDFQGLVQSFAKLDFPEAHLDDGWALNAHDALTTVIAAVGMIPATAEVNPAVVHAAIANNFRGQPVPGAIQPLTFDRDGNRTGSPVVVRLCPLPDDETRTRTVLAGPGYSGVCPYSAA